MNDELNRIAESNEEFWKSSLSYSNIFLLDYGAF